MTDDVVIEDDQDKKEMENETPPTEFVTYPITIAGNSLRNEIILTASKTNQGLIWLGGEENTGTPLAPSEKITLETDEPITVLGEAGDWLYVAELAVIEPVSKSIEQELR